MTELSLKPGDKIKPELSVLQAKAFAQLEYGLDISDITELISYDDRNFLITVESGARFVFKVLNKLDSKFPPHTEAQNQMMLHLRSKGINCPSPVPNKRGELVTEFRLKGEDGQDLIYLARLLTYIHGEILHKVQYSAQLFYQVGELTAKVSTALQDFHHEGLMKYGKIWRLDAVPRVLEFSYAVEIPERRRLVEEVINCFKETVIPLIDDLPKSAVHGDLNEQNLVVEETADGYKMAGVIDFGDIHFSCTVFELAISMCYMILECPHSQPLDTGGCVLAGYLKHRTLSEVECSLLKVCISARLSQSLVLGAYSYLQDRNEYTLTTAKKGWTVLELLWKTPESDLYRQWDINVQKMN